jgi:hypothetical protein
LQEKLDDEVIKARLVLSNDYEELSIREVKPLDILGFVLVSLWGGTEPCHVTVVSLFAKAEPCRTSVRIDSSCALEIAV